MENTINNAVALLEECIVNGDDGILSLESWFLGERHLIEQTVMELNEIENAGGDK